MATLLLDLLTKEEETIDRRSAEYRFDIDLLAERLVAATDGLAQLPVTSRFSQGYFGASTDAALISFPALEKLPGTYPLGCLEAIGVKSMLVPRSP